MLDWQGNMVQLNHQHRIILKDVDIDAEMADVIFIGEAETTAIGKVLGSDDGESISQ